MLSPEAPLGRAVWIPAAFGGPDEFVGLAVSFDWMAFIRVSTSVAKVSLSLDDAVDAEATFSSGDETRPE